jgi:hypothetical protein
MDKVSILLATVPIVLGVAVSGCYSKATAREGRFTFAYASMVEHENFVKPIAPGAKLEIHAFANGTHDKLTIASARSSRPAVVAVDKVLEHGVIVRGREVGTAEIEITTRDASGKELVDKMFFHVANPAKHGLQHGCTDEPSAVYVRGEEIVIHHGLATSDGRPVIGFDYAPVAIEPAGALELVEQPQAGGYYAYRASAAKERITLRSKVDERVLTLRVVDRKDLTKADLHSPDRMLETHTEYVFAEVHAGGDAGPLCHQNALTKARSLTPEICKATAKLDDDPDAEDSNHLQIARVTALKFGVCKFEVTLPELGGGRGIVLAREVKVGREEYPGERKSRAGLLGSSLPFAIAGARDGLALLGWGVWWVVARRRRARSGGAAAPPMR